jgi:hypothetical protein
MRKIRIGELFCGPGGLALGAQLASGTFRKFGYDSEQKVINLFYKVFPSYEKMPDSARDIFDQLLDYDSVTYNPWTGEGEINEVKRKYILGNKILTEAQLKKLIRHLL